MNHLYLLLALLFFALVILVITRMITHINRLKVENELLRKNVKAYNTNHNELLKKQMDLTILQSQINPHFLYNTLEAIRSQAEISNQEDIALATEKLSSYFRYCINSHGEPVHLFEELQNIQDYFHIIQFRFFDRIKLEIKIEDDSILHTYLPRMTLQPLVENAINHGLKDKIHDALITISAARSDTSVYLKISDNGCGMTDEKIQELEDRLSLPVELISVKKCRHGVALPNVHHRIQLMFGKNYGLHIESIYEHGTNMCIEYSVDYTNVSTSAKNPRKEIIRLVDATTISSENTPIHHMFFTIFPGQILYLVGLHGNGKTSLKNVLCGLTQLSSGELIVNGKEYSSFTPVDSVREGIFSLERASVKMIGSLTVYENLELFCPARRQDSRLHLYNKKAAKQNVKNLLKEFHLTIDPDAKIWQLSQSDIMLLCLMEAVYSNAKLVIFNTSGFNISYAEKQQVSLLLNQMHDRGMAFLFICDSFIDMQLKQGIVNIIRKGYIVKQFPENTLELNEANQILLQTEGSTFHRSLREKSASIIGVLELSYSKQSLQQYCASLTFAFEKHSEFIDICKNTMYLKADDICNFCTNLSVGDNIAMVRYPKIASRYGVVDKSVLLYLEDNFNILLAECAAGPKHKIKDLRNSDQKILGIERWVQAGYTNIVIEDPLLGLDAEGQRTVTRYLSDLSKRNVNLMLIFYNLSGLQEICDAVYICDHGCLHRTIRADSKLELNHVLQDLENVESELSIK